MPVEPASVVLRGGSASADTTADDDDISSQTDDTPVEGGQDDDSSQDAAADGDAASDDSPSTPLSALERLAKEQGLDLRTKYKDDADLLKSYKELHGKLHERDQDAALGRVFKEHEAEFRQYLASQKAGTGNGQTPTPDAPKRGPAMSADEYFLLQARLIDPKTGELRSDASAQDVTRFREAHAAVERNVVSMALQTKEAIANAVQEILAEKERQWQETASQQAAKSADMQAVNEFYADNAGWLYQDGKSQESGLRPEGQRFMAIADQVYEDEVRKGRHDPQTGLGTPYSTIHDIALGRYLKEQNRTPDRPGVKPQGKRKPSSLSRPESATARFNQLVEKFSMSEAMDRMVKEGYDLNDLE